MELLNGKSLLKRRKNFGLYFLVQFYNLLGHDLLSPFRMVCRDFILLEIANLVLLFLEFAQLIGPVVFVKLILAAHASTITRKDASYNTFQYDCITMRNSHIFSSLIRFGK